MTASGGACVTWNRCAKRERRAIGSAPAGAVRRARRRRSRIRSESPQAHRPPPRRAGLCSDCGGTVPRPSFSPSGVLALTANSTMHWHWLIATSATPASVERGSTTIFNGVPPPPPSATLCDAWPGWWRSIGVDPLPARVLVAIGRSGCDPAHQQAADQVPSERGSLACSRRGGSSSSQNASATLADSQRHYSGKEPEITRSGRSLEPRTDRAAASRHRLRLEPRRGVPVVAPRDWP